MIIGFFIIIIKASILKLVCICVEAFFFIDSFYFNNKNKEGLPIQRNIKFQS